MAYIKLEDVLEVLNKRNMTKNIAINEIKNLPTADVVEVKHGEWIEKEEVYGDVYYTCSNCNNDWTTIDGTPQDNFMDYCPNCGAKMDGRSDT